MSCTGEMSLLYVVHKYYPIKSSLFLQHLLFGIISGNEHEWR